jgi:type VI secretion system protein VasD
MSQLERGRGLRCFAWLVSVGLSLVCSGCGLWPKPPSAPCTLPTRARLEASERLNPDAQGAALPTVVRVYQLQAVARIEEADFVDVWQTPVPVLGPDLVASRELTLFPGQSTWVDLPLEPQVRFVVAVAIFRRPTATQWRSIIPLPESSRLCAEYKVRGAPKPAFTFRFDQYRAEGRSALLALPGAAAHDLPDDVAPDRTTASQR